MKSNNVFFEQNGRKMYGMRYGYAVEYELTKEAGMDHIRFASKLIMPDDPQNWKKPLPIDLVSELLYELAREKKHLVVSIYGIWVNFTEKDTAYDIKRRIRQMQSALIKFDSGLTSDIKAYLQNGVFELIKGMPVY